MTKGGFHLSHTWGLVLDGLIAVVAVGAFAIGVLIIMTWFAHALGLIR